MGHYLDLGTGCCGLGTLSRWLSYKEFRSLQSSSEMLAWCSLFRHYRKACGSNCFRPEAGAELEE